MRSVKASVPRRPKRLPVFAIILVSVAAGYAFAITIAKSGAPKQTVYELPHDFTLNAPTFLPSALPGAAMTSGNRLELLENGDAIFPAMLAAISSARKTVNFEAYIFWSDEVGTRFRDALAERAAHGVAVRVLLDAIGSPGQRMKASDVDVLRQAGCHVEFFHSMKPWMLWVFNHRNHRRVLVVDGTLGFTGGVGFADPWRGNADSKEHWRDTQVRVEGPAVRGLQRAFQENWSEVTGEALVGDEFFPALRAGRHELRRRRAVVTARGDVGSGPRLRDLARRRREGDLDRELLLPSGRRDGRSPGRCREEGSGRAGDRPVGRAERRARDESGGTLVLRSAPRRGA